MYDSIVKIQPFINWFSSGLSYFANNGNQDTSVLRNNVNKANTTTQLYFSYLSIKIMHCPEGLVRSDCLINLVSSTYV
jgi:hypothetical protein